MLLGNFYFKIKILILLVVMPLATSYGLVGVIAVACCMLDALYCVSRVRNGGLKMYGSSFLAACFYLLWNILIFVLFDFSGVERLIQAVCVTLCFLSSCCLDRSCIDLRFVRNVIAFQVLLFCLWWPVSGFVTNYYSAFYSHGNFLGGLLAIYLALLMLIHHLSGRKMRTTYLLIYAAMAFLFAMSNNRAIYLTVLVLLVGCLFVSWGKPQNLKKRGTILLLGAIAVAVAITIIYPLLLNTALGLKLELLSRAIFNKNFFSGRQTIWRKLEEHIVRSPYIGFGLGAIPNMFYNTDYSSHNFWLQTALQSGLIGIGTVGAFYLNAVYRSYYQGSKEWYLAVSFGAAYIIHECFEVSLTQNNFCLGLLVWFFFGLMIALKKNKLTV